VAYGIERRATSAPDQLGGWELDAMAHGIQTRYLGTMAHSANPYGSKLGIRYQWCKHEFFSIKGLK
jgi:hypothetical protein